jgi:SAM-dependent methyltransferase
MNTEIYSTNPCPVCGETDPDCFRIWFDGHLKLFRCHTCSFISAFPSPGKSSVIYDYRDLYNLDFTKNGQKFMYPERENALTDIAGRIKKIIKTGDLLDVGCGDGQFLYQCSVTGFNCKGVEESKILSDYASKLTKLEVICGKYVKDMFPPQSFDVVTMVQVLEHIPDPGNALEAARYHLRENGIIVIEVPSVNSPHFLAYRLTRLQKFVKNSNGVIYSHVGYHKPTTIMNLTGRHGFEKIVLVTGRWQYKYSGSLRLIGRGIDPALNLFGIGGILYIGRKK